MKVNEVPGFPCPQCGKLVHIDFAEFLRTGEATCSYCLLRLSIDRKASDAFVETMRSPPIMRGGKGR
ncbi:hypothetical protein FHR20_001084 [Sphingomonas leidyi]|uniref:Uncharacterized protein n=1 Tax=Sphingomonas leidyi TaxID=68569 RepID=A0A7X5ZV89_9SPHN|nr:hypothetical protein [Sphingomonas leidyi]